VSDKIEVFVNNIMTVLSNYYKTDINDSPILEAEGSYILSSQIDKVINKYKNSEQYQEWYKSHQEQHKLLLNKSNEYAHIVKQSRKKKRKKKKRSKTHKKRI
jgi:activator of 2-hydroxyglutaryl-CoA dehydratase